MHAHAAWIAGEVLARDVSIGEALPDSPAFPATAEVDLDGVTARIALIQD